MNAAGRILRVVMVPLAVVLLADSKLPAAVPAGCSVAAHPDHATAAEVEWNAETGCFEVSLQLPGVVLEEELSALRGQRVNLETTPQAEQLLQQYVEARFQLSGREFSRCRMQWVGMELELKHVWAYFELRPEAGDRLPVGVQPALQLQATSSLLASREGQVNLLSLTVGTARGTAHLTSQQSTAAVQFERGRAVLLLQY
jgi:hypothetical protein